MITATAARSGKSHRNENFPVASWLIRARHRGPILAFYRFARAADDVADHPSLKPDEKLALLDRLGEALTGIGPSDPEAEPLRIALAERGLPARHALDLLDAFRLDIRKTRCANWSELMAYCTLSAMPVGRFVLDVHGEDPAVTWGASDAICSALQVINHLQDCGEDFRTLDRVYLPLDALAAHGVELETIGAERGNPALRSCVAELARRTEALLGQGVSLPYLVTETRLALEIAAIVRLAETLLERLKHPSRERVHLGKARFASTGLAGASSCLLRRGWHRSWRSLATGVGPWRPRR